MQTKAQDKEAEKQVFNPSYPLQVPLGNTRIQLLCATVDEIIKCNISLTEVQMCKMCKSLSRMFYTLVDFSKCAVPLFSSVALLC